MRLEGYNCRDSFANIFLKDHFHRCALIHVSMLTVVAERIELQRNVEQKYGARKTTKANPGGDDSKFSFPVSGLS